MQKPDFDYWWFTEGSNMMPDGYQDENERHYKTIAKAAFQFALLEMEKNKEQLEKDVDKAQ